MWLRTKKSSLGVIQVLKPSSGISKSSGRTDLTIISFLGLSAARTDRALTKAATERKKRLREGGIFVFIAV
jgi:hypothetical protein